MAAGDLYRTAIRRAHRQLSFYLLTQAWVQHVDCVVVTRDELMTYLDLANMQRKRLSWLKDDLRPEFAHSEAMFTRGTGVWQTLYMSRAPFPKGFGWGIMTTAARIAKLKDHGLRTVEVAIPPETWVVENLARLAVGLAPPEAYRRS
jgi:hypothetical protein